MKLGWKVRGIVAGKSPIKMTCFAATPNGALACFLSLNAMAKFNRITLQSFLPPFKAACETP